MLGGRSGGELEPVDEALDEPVLTGLGFEHRLHVGERASGPEGTDEGGEPEHVVTVAPGRDIGDTDG